MGYTAMSNAAPQHLQALQHANRVRLARAGLKRKVAASEVSASTSRGMTLSLFFSRASVRAVWPSVFFSSISAPER